MPTTEEKMKQVQSEIGHIEAVNNVLIDSIWNAEASGEADFVILLEYQKEHIRNITNLF